MWLGLALIASALVLACQSAQAQSQLRTVIGHVLNAQNQPVQKAVVHLKNTRTLAIKTYITEGDGSYRFSALAPNVDYEIYAEHNGDRSDTKTLSAFDNRTQLTVTLKIKSEK
jgi:hypothetical protein